MEDFKKYKFKLVNGEIEPFSQWDEAIIDEYGMPVHEDNYGMGCVHWPLMEKKTDAKKVNEILNINWAKRRLLWAEKEAPNEVEFLKDVISGKKQNFKLV